MEVGSGSYLSCWGIANFAEDSRETRSSPKEPENLKRPGSVDNDERRVMSGFWPC